MMNNARMKVWLTRINAVANEENKKRDGDYSEYDETIISVNPWRHILFGALFGVGSTLLIQGVNNLSTEYYALKAENIELKQHATRTGQRTTGFDLYTIVPEPLPKSYTDLEVPPNLPNTSYTDNGSHPI